MGTGDLSDQSPEKWDPSELPQSPGSAAMLGSDRSYRRRRTEYQTVRRNDLILHKESSELLLYRVLVDRVKAHACASHALLAWLVYAQSSFREKIWIEEGKQNVRWVQEKLKRMIRA
jgi:hypothetical protein